MSVNAEARSSSIGSFLPANSTVLPSDRDDASAFRWLTGKFRRSSVRRISCPTAPVAPTTAMRYEFMSQLVYGKYRQGSNPLLKRGRHDAASDTISRYRPGRGARQHVALRHRQLDRHKRAEDGPNLPVGHDCRERHRLFR